jgi:putative flavoprotein involved in K+ transport
MLAPSQTKLVSAPAATPVLTNGGHEVADSQRPERFDTVVVGGGQAGLAMGYHLARLGSSFVILDANNRIGAVWRARWDTLRVFTTARYDGLPGLHFPAPPHAFPTKDEIADYLEAYAAQMQLPVRTGVHVDRVSRVDGGGGDYLVAAGDRRYVAAQVVIASGAYRHPSVPSFANELDPGIRQLHSSDYRNPSQLQEGGVLVVGASNSGAEIAFDVARAHRTWLSGRNTGKLPFRIDGRPAQVIDRAFWLVANHVLTMKTPIGRKALPVMRSHGGPLERVKPVDLATAGVSRVHARTAGVHDGLPLLADGQVMDVANVIWCTGFRQEFGWIDLPIFGDDGWPCQDRGVIAAAPGLYFLGLPFMYSFTSALIGGVGRDAAHVAEQIAIHARQTGMRRGA